MEITFINKVGKAAPIPRAAILNLAKKMESAIKKNQRKKNLSLIFVSLGESEQLNRKYRQRSKGANVLSFPSSEKDELGDIIICPEIAAREAKTGKNDYSERISYLFIHGLLHLLGYDHQTIAGERKMEEMAKVILDTKKY